MWKSVPEHHVKDIAGLLGPLASAAAIFHRICGSLAIEDAPVHCLVDAWTGWSHGGRADGC